MQDVGLSVRKRVIKILKEICELRPDNENVPDIFNQIARRYDPTPPVPAARRGLY